MHPQYYSKYLSAEREERNWFFSSLGCFNAFALFTAQISALDFTTSGGQILFIVGETQLCAEQEINLGKAQRSSPFPHSLAMTNWEWPEQAFHVTQNLFW